MTGTIRAERHDTSRVLVSFAILILTMIVADGCTRDVRVPENVTIGPIKTLEQQITVRPVKVLQERARVEAKKWQPDAFLVSLSVDALTPALGTPPPMADLLSFEFHSYSDPHESYVVGFLLDGSVEIWKPPLSSPDYDYIPIEPTDWTIDSIDAWQIAQDNGGTEFFKKNQTKGAHASLALQRWIPPRSGRVLWYVHYGAWQGGDALRIWIDAKTGAVVDKKAP